MFDVYMTTKQVNSGQRTYPGVVQDDAAGGDDVSWYSVAGHSLEDVEVAGLMVRRGGDGSRRL